jgi:hypothetical protein
LSLVDVSGESLGTALLEGDPVRSLLMPGAVVGQAAGNGTIVRTCITSGFIFGHGILTLWHDDLSGYVHGIGALSGIMVRCVGLHGFVIGSSRLVWSYPMPLRGFTTLAAYVEVFRVPLPICLRPPVRSYRWGQDLQRGDLAIWLRQVGGFAISPYRVTYTLYMVMSGGQLRLVGPPQREPARGDVGEFYATGVAGAGGQPGRWVIKWYYQIFFNGPIYEESMEFDVLDAFMAGVPDPGRVCKRGWF